MARGRAEVPQDRLGSPHEQREAGVLVSGPLADVGARHVADVVRIEEQHRSEVGALEGRSGSNFLVVASSEPLDAQAILAAVASVPRPASLLEGESLSQFRGDAQILTDDYAPVDQLLQRP